MIVDWIAADWRGKDMTLWTMAGRRPVDTRTCAADPSAEPSLMLSTLMEGWPAVPVFACGMMGAHRISDGPALRSAPCPATTALTVVEDGPGGRPLHLVRGIGQDDPPDVMGGDETRVAGLLALDPDFDGVVCLPGLQSRWVRVSAGEICNFKTFMTGELFALIARSSALRDAVAAGEARDDAPFLQAVSDAMTRPERGYGGLYGLHAASVLRGMAPAEARARLSGALIGMELAAARPWWLGTQVTIIGSRGSADRYAAALAAQGLSPARMDAAEATLAGLHAARSQAASGA